MQTNLTRLEITELLLSAPKYRRVEIRQMTVPIRGSYNGMIGLDPIWNIPYADKTIATISVVMAVISTYLLGNKAVNKMKGE